MLTQVLVTSAILGIITPVVLDVSMIPIITQAKNKNFQEAELQATLFMTKSVKDKELATLPSSCTLDTEDEELQNYTISCTHGTHSKVKAIASRSFTLYEPGRMGGYNNPDRQFAFEAPSKYSHIECPVNDPWGVMYYNEHLKAGHLDACLPSPVWSEARYLESDPDDWLYDLSDHGYGRHPDF